MKLKDKIIVITGASDGIGKQIALRLAKENTRLALIARDKKRLTEVSKLSKQLGAAEVKIYLCDICKTKKLEKTVKDIVSYFGSIDILINNAGIWQKINPLEKIKKDIVDEIIGTNLTGLIHITKLFLPVLKKQKECAEYDKDNPDKK